MAKMTKQGVRDLNHLKTPKKERMYFPPTEAFECKHDCDIIWDSGLYWAKCKKCKQTVGEPW